MNYWHKRNTGGSVPPMMDNIPNPSNAPVSKVSQTDRYGNKTEITYDTKAAPMHGSFESNKMAMLPTPPVPSGPIPDMNDPTNRDSVPAMLTEGEYVVNKEATQMFGPQIHAMNQHGLAQRHAENQAMMNGGPVPYNSGGPVMTPQGVPGYFLGGLVEAAMGLFGGGQPAQDPYAGYSGYNQQGYLNEAQNFNNPGAQTQGYSTINGMSNPQGTTDYPSLDMPYSEMDKHHGAVQPMGMGNAPIQDNLPAIDMTPPAPFSDQDLLQNSSESKEKTEQELLRVAAAEQHKRSQSHMMQDMTDPRMVGNYGGTTSGYGSIPAMPGRNFDADMGTGWTQGMNQQAADQLIKETAIPFAGMETTGGRGQTGGGVANKSEQGPQNFNMFGGQGWEIYKDTVGGIESGNKYDIKGGYNDHYDGRYQMGKAAKEDAARILGIDMPTREEFRKNPQLQDEMFKAYTEANHKTLMRLSPAYAAMTPQQQQQILGYAHNQGAGGAIEFLKTGEAGRDGFGTDATKYADALASAQGNISNWTGSESGQVNQGTASSVSPLGGRYGYESGMDAQQSSPSFITSGSGGEDFYGLNQNVQIPANLADYPGSMGVPAIEGYGIPAVDNTQLLKGLPVDEFGNIKVPQGIQGLMSHIDKLKSEGNVEGANQVLSKLDPAWQVFYNNKDQLSALNTTKSQQYGINEQHVNDTLTGQIGGLENLVNKDAKTWEEYQAAETALANAQEGKRQSDAVLSAEQMDQFRAEEAKMMAELEEAKANAIGAKGTAFEDRANEIAAEKEANLAGLQGQMADLKDANTVPVPELGPETQIPIYEGEEGGSIDWTNYDSKPTEKEKQIKESIESQLQMTEEEYESASGVAVGQGVEAVSTSTGKPKTDPENTDPKDTEDTINTQFGNDEGSKAGGMLKGILSDMFGTDNLGSALARGLVMYLGARLTGMSGNQALALAAKDALAQGDRVRAKNQEIDNIQKNQVDWSKVTKEQYAGLKDGSITFGDLPKKEVAGKYDNVKQQLVDWTKVTPEQFKALEDGTISYEQLPQKTGGQYDSIKQGLVDWTQVTPEQWKQLEDGKISYEQLPQKQAAASFSKGAQDQSDSMYVAGVPVVPYQNGSNPKDTKRYVDYDLDGDGVPETYTVQDFSNAVKAKGIEVLNWDSKQHSYDGKQNTFKEHVAAQVETMNYGKGDGKGFSVNDQELSTAMTDAYFDFKKHNPTITDAVLNKQITKATNKYLQDLESFKLGKSDIKPNSLDTYIEDSIFKKEYAPSGFDLVMGKTNYKDSSSIFNSILVNVADDNGKRIKPTDKGYDAAVEAEITDTMNGWKWMKANGLTKEWEAAAKDYTDAAGQARPITGYAMFMKALMNLSDGGTTEDATLAWNSYQKSKNK